MTTDMPVIKSIPNIAPNDVATPLPPLNFKNIDIDKKIENFNDKNY